MASLQKPFEYKGDATQIPFQYITLEAKIPLFLYNRLPIDYENFQRLTEGFSITSSIQKLAKGEYQIHIPIEKIIGEDINSKYGFFRYHKIETLARTKIDEFVFGISVVAKDEFENKIEKIEFKAIYGVKSTPITGFRDYKAESINYTAAYGLLSEPNLPNIDKLIKNESDKVFLINKNVFDALREEIGVIIGNTGVHSELFLLFLIEGLVDLSDDYPKIIEPIEKYRKDWLMSILAVNEVQNPLKVLNLVIKKFDTLFDFPISIPEIKTVEVKGTLTISSEEQVEENYLEFYDLSVEYPEINNSFKILRYDWSEHDEDLINNSTSISFIDEQLILLNSIDGEILVQVKGFDGSVLWSKEYYPDDIDLQNLEIEVPLYIPDSVRTNPANNTFTSSKRLRGRVVQMGNKYKLNDLTVLVQAKKEGDQLFKIVGSAETDGNGNFSLSYPYGIYKEAQALVSLMPDSPADINVSEVDADKEKTETISDDFIFLLLQEEEVVDYEEDKEEEDCSCHTPQKAKRLPDQADLIESGEYTQDIGGTCLNLSTPNRTLREYNYNAIVRISDPDVANYVLNKREIEDEKGNKTTVFDLERGKGKINRGIVDLDNPIRWEDAPDAKNNLSVYQAVTVATGHILHFKSVFKADGYSLGDLVYSLPLAPGQKKQIVVFESSHSFSGSETQSLTQGEQLSASLLYDRFITDEIGGSIGESVSGRSSASTGGVSAGLGVAGSYAGAIGGSLGVAGGYSKSSSSASQNSSRNISQYFDELLKQQITQNAESFRALNASVVTTVTEGQDYGVTAETIANHNHCHSLTMMYFEVLRHYAIFQEISHVEECIFVPLLMTNFSTENIHKWKDVLAKNLLPIPSNTYLNQSPVGYIAHHQIFRSPLTGRISRQHPLLKAFDANERIKTDYARVDFPDKDETYADGNMDQIRGRFTMNVNMARPKTTYDRIKSLPIIKTTVSSQELDIIGTVKKNVIASMTSAIIGPFSSLLGGSSSRTNEETILIAGEIFDKFMTLDANYTSVPPARCIRVIKFMPDSIVLSDGTIIESGDEFFDGGLVDKELWTGYANILGYTGDNGVYEMLDYYFNGRLIAEWDSIFYNDIMPLVFARIVDSISIHWGEVTTEKIGDNEVIKHTGGGFNLDFSTGSTYKGGNRRVYVNFNSGQIGKKRSDLPLYISVSSSIDGLTKFKNHVKLNIGSVSIDYTTAHFQGSLYRGYINDDLLDGTNLYIPLTDRDKINPRKEDEYIVNQLIEHLNSNLEYYNKLLWNNLDQDRRYMLLDGFNIETFNAFGYSSGFRSLASVVKNQLITIAGNSLVFPVADGYKVSQSFIMEDLGDGVEQETSLLDYYKPFTPIPPYRLSVPTRGVFMEAVQGSCDACEMVKENSSQDWDKFRTEEPTSIQPIVTPTPTITDYNPQYRDFANPLVNIQNTPDAPAPGVAFNQLTDLLGKAGVFNDITGLAGNQENAIKTYLSNQENAKAFAEMATKLASMEHNTKNAKDTSEHIKKSGLTNEKQVKYEEELIKKRMGIDNNSPEEERKDTVKDLKIIQDAKDKGQLDDNQVKEVSEDRVRKGQELSKPRPRKKTNTINLSIWIRDINRKPMLNSTFILDFGPLQEILECTNETDGFFQFKDVPVNPDETYKFVLKGLPVNRESFIAPEFDKHYYYRGSLPITINKSNYIIQVQEQRVKKELTIGTTKSKSDALTEWLENTSETYGGVDFWIVDGRFKDIDKDGTTKVNTESEGTNDQETWTVFLPTGNLKMSATQSGDIALEDS